MRENLRVRKAVLIAKHHDGFVPGGEDLAIVGVAGSGTAPGDGARPMGSGRFLFEGPVKQKTP